MEGWWYGPDIPELLMKGSIVVAGAAAIRLCFTGFRLYFKPRRALAKSGVGGDSFAEDTAITYALSTHPPPERIPGACEPQRISELIYQGELRAIELRSARATGMTLLLVSLITLAFGAQPMRIYHCALFHRSYSGCLTDAGIHLFTYAGIQLTLSATIYLVSGMLQQRLERRIAEWKLFCARFGGPQELR